MLKVTQQVSSWTGIGTQVSSQFGALSATLPCLPKIAQGSIAHRVKQPPESFGSPLFPCSPSMIWAKSNPLNTKFFPGLMTGWGLDSGQGKALRLAETWHCSGALKPEGANRQEWLLPCHHLIWAEDTTTRDGEEI